MKNIVIERRGEILNGDIIGKVKKNLKSIKWDEIFDNGEKAIDLGIKIIMGLATSSLFAFMGLLILGINL